MPGEAHRSTESSIEALPEIIAALPHSERTIVERLFQVVAADGELVPPSEMYPWIERTFGSVANVRRQSVIRVTNRWTYEGAIFNPLRSRRPNTGTSQNASSWHADDVAIRERIEQTLGDDFCDPVHRTPEDVFGRVRGSHTITSSNVAKADGWHGVAVFDRHDPLAIDESLVEDLLSVAGEWGDRCHAADPAALHFFLLWNCLWRAGASLIHGHIQMTLSHTMAHGRVMLLRDAARRYRAETGNDYFADLVEAHRILGLTIDNAPSAGDGDGDDTDTNEDASGGKVERFVSLTPVKEREVTCIAPTYYDGRLDPAELGTLAEPLASTLRVALDDLHVRAFNIAAYGPPLAASAEISAEWAGFPLVARFVDRGSPLSSTVDIAALELFGSSVVASDPFDVARAVRRPAQTPIPATPDSVERPQL